MVFMDDKERARRSAASRARIVRAGMTMNGYTLWTEDEDDVIRQSYPDHKAMQKALPHRTYGAILGRAQKFGLKRKIHLWQGSEIAKLRRMYARASPEEIMAAFPGVTWKAIKHVAIRQGVCRPAHSYKRTGQRPMDDVLDRLEEIGWTMCDLDEECGTGTYFQSHSWRHYKLNHNAIARAVQVLGGSLTAQWTD